MQTAAARLVRVTLQVGDIEQAVCFLTILLGIGGRRIPPGRHAWDCAGVLLVCYHPRAEGQELYPIPSPNTLYLSVANLDEVFARAKFLCALDLTTATQTGGSRERRFTVKDPFWNPVCFVEDAQETGADSDHRLVGEPV
jgi:hypothetical protein